MIKWKEEYSTGVAKLDQQHRSLFEYCNELEGTIKDGPIAVSTVELALRFLERYVKGHFGQEEACMHQHACPIADKNKFAHQQFIQMYESLQQKFINNKTNEANAKETLQVLHQFLEKWLIDHICQIETKLKPCVN